MTNEKLNTIDLKDLESAHGGEMPGIGGPRPQGPQGPDPTGPLNPIDPLQKWPKQRPCHVCGLG